MDSWMNNMGLPISLNSSIHPSINCLPLQQNPSRSSSPGDSQNQNQNQPSRASLCISRPSGSLHAHPIPYYLLPCPLCRCSLSPVGSVVNLVRPCLGCVLCPLLHPSFTSRSLLHQPLPLRSKSQPILIRRSLGSRSFPFPTKKLPA
jgi:hypothetical protein